MFVANRAWPQGCPPHLCEHVFRRAHSWLRSTDSSWSLIWRRSRSSCFSMSIGEQLFSSSRSSVCSLCRCCSCAAFKVGGASLPKPEKAFIQNTKACCAWVVAKPLDLSCGRPAGHHSADVLVACLDAPAYVEALSAWKGRAGRKGV